MEYGVPQVTNPDTDWCAAMSVLGDAIWMACRLLTSFHCNDASRITHIFRDVDKRGYQI